MIAESSPAGADVDPAERQSITAELDRRYPDHPRVASLPDLQDRKISAVAAELRAETAANQPPACRP